MNARAAPSRPQHGGTLIEILVAVLVLALGMLGAAALHAAALRNNQSNFEHAQMSVLGHSMLDAMRGNVAAARG